MKKVIKSALKSAGIEINRIPQKKISQRENDLLPIFDEPLAALAYEHAGHKAAFNCPLKLTLKSNGLSYSPDSYHPFVETLKEYESGKITTYEGSLLESYYRTHQPYNAAEAIIGFDKSPEFFKSQPAHIYWLSPWRPDDAQAVDKIVKEFTKKHSISHGEVEMTLESDGYQYHGPVSEKKGRLEYQRLVRVFESIRKNGYDRSLGHAHFLVLKRGSSIRYLAQGSGNHRIAAMSALGYETVPALFQKSGVIDVEMAQFWVQVQKNVWSLDQAVAYFNYLFDFDSRAWAFNQGLLHLQ